MADEDTNENGPYREDETAPSGEVASDSTPDSNGGSNFLTHKMGPLPVWGWVLVAGASFLLFRWWRNRSAATSGTTPDSGITPSNAPPGSGDGTATPPPPALTEEQWLSHAKQNLLALGYTNKAIEDAFRVWLEGGELSQAQAHLIETAINVTGHPPVGLPIHVRPPHPVHAPPFHGGGTGGTPTR
jgi:hypothetical protein